MNEEPSEYQESGSNESGFKSRAKGKGLDRLKKNVDKAKQGIKKAWKILPTKAKIIMIIGVIAGAALFLILIVCFAYVLKVDLGKDTSGSKKAMVNIAAGRDILDETQNNESDTIFENEASFVDGLFTNTENGLQLNIRENENFQEIFTELDMDLNSLEDWELIKELLIYFECEEYQYTEEEWKCMLTFLQAEAVTLYPDMREKSKIGTPAAFDFASL